MLSRGAQPLWRMESRHLFRMTLWAMCGGEGTAGQEPRAGEGC